MIISCQSYYFFFTSYLPNIKFNINDNEWIYIVVSSAWLGSSLTLNIQKRQHCFRLRSTSTNVSLDDYYTLYARVTFIVMFLWTRNSRDNNFILLSFFNFPVTFYSPPGSLSYNEKRYVLSSWASIFTKWSRMVRSDEVHRIYNSLCILVSNYKDNKLIFQGFDRFHSTMLSRMDSVQCLQYVLHRR